MAVRVTVCDLHVSSLLSICKWGFHSSQRQLCLRPTFLNEVEKKGSVYAPLQVPRILTTDQGYCFGSATLVMELGEAGIRGVGVCCRPGSAEKVP